MCGRLARATNPAEIEAYIRARWAAVIAAKAAKLVATWQLTEPDRDGDGDGDGDEGGDGVEAALASDVGGPEPLLVRARSNVAPRDPQLVLSMNRDGTEGRLKAVRWGFQAGWGKRPFLINAKSESWSGPGRSFWSKGRRAVVWSTGYYEFEKLGGKRKQPWLVRLADELYTPLAALLVWDRDSQEERCVVLTTEPADAIAFIHPRMPVIVPVQRLGAWLDPASRPEDLAELCRPLAGELLHRHPVDRSVGNVMNQAMSLVEPVAVDPGSQAAGEAGEGDAGSATGPADQTEPLAIGETGSLF